MNILLNLSICLNFFIFILCQSPPYQSLKCETLKPPENGYFRGGYCSNVIGSACALTCRQGYKLYGSSFRQCLVKHKTENSIEYPLVYPTWSGYEAKCEIMKCKELNFRDNIISNCTKLNKEYGTVCNFTCPYGFINTGSATRRCISIGLWSGIEAKCIQSYDENKIFMPFTTTDLVTTQTTTEFLSYYYDLSEETISFGYSFKKIKLNLQVNTLPITFSIWLRSNYTKNIKILHYDYACGGIIIQTNENSSLIMNLKYTHNNYNLKKKLIKNKWTLLSIIHTKTDLKVLLDGGVHFSLDSEFLDSNNTDIMAFHSIKCINGVQISNKSENGFKILDDLETTNHDSLQPMRGEITRVYLYNNEFHEEDILSSYYRCEEYARFIHRSKIIYDWSNVLFDRNMELFKRKPSTFCKGCIEPKLIDHALILFDGTKNGDVLSYSCQENYKIYGKRTSICTIYGSWSEKTPRCKRIGNGNGKTKNGIEIQKYDVNNGLSSNNLVIKINNYKKSTVL